MSIRNLEQMFRPASVAVIGATDRERSIGSLVMRNLREAGFAGPIWPVNPKHKTVAGMPAFAKVADLPQAPGLAMICTPARTVPRIVAALGEKGTRAAVVLSAGLRAPASQGKTTLEQQMLDAARVHLLRILGPDCIGLLVPGAKLNASYAHTQAMPGKLAFVSQSDALTTALLDWANARSIGFSHFVSLGDSADVDVADMLDYLGSDPGTRAILLYLESLRSARRFMSAARAAARNKPVLVVKAGRAPDGAKAASSHTGALAGADKVFDAAIRRAGMLRVDTLDELFDAAETVARVRPLYGDRLAILTNSGGAGVLAVDALSKRGARLAELGVETMAALDLGLPSNWSHGNPVDIIGDAPVPRYTAALEVLFADRTVDAVLLMHAPTAMVPSLEVAEACVPLMRSARKTVLTSWLGGRAVEEARQLCAHSGIPIYHSPERAVAAFAEMVTYRRNQESLIQTPESVPGSFSPDVGAARESIQRALDAGREWLSEHEAKQVLRSYGIPVAETRVANGVEEAVAAAEEIGYPVVLKILSPDITHKSDIGGVALDLKAANNVRGAAEAILRRVRDLRPDAGVVGFTVQAMVRRQFAHELIVGASIDPVFGPTILFGQGGTAVEVLQDRAFALPPLNMALVDDLVSRTRVSRLLAGYRDREAVHREALYTSILQVSQIVCDIAEVCEIDVNPLLVDAEGVIALDARIKVAPATQSAVDRLAIRPYPTELQERIMLAGLPLELRPIRPEDEPLMRDFYADADPDDMRLRFFMSRREVPHSELARYSQLDYDRDMAFVAIGSPAPGEPPALMGEVRGVSDPDGRVAEFAIQLHRSWQGRGLGSLLMQRIIDYQRRRGTQELVGECLAENQGMRKLAQKMGFTVKRPQGEDYCTLRLVL